MKVVRCSPQAKAKAEGYGAVDFLGKPHSPVISPPCGELGVESPVQSNHCERTGSRVRLSRQFLCLRRLVSSHIIAAGDAEWRARRRFRVLDASPTRANDSRIVAPLRFLLGTRRVAFVNVNHDHEEMI
jgi:hypothetical protein